MILLNLQRLCGLLSTKIEQTLKLRVHHVFIYDDVETMKAKEFSDF